MLASVTRGIADYLTGYDSNIQRQLKLTHVFSRKPPRTDALPTPRYALLHYERQSGCRSRCSVPVIRNHGEVITHQALRISRRYVPKEYDVKHRIGTQNPFSDTSSGILMHNKQKLVTEDFSFSIKSGGPEDQSGRPVTVLLGCGASADAVVRR